jgi:protease-4
LAQLALDQKWGGWIENEEDVENSLIETGTLVEDSETYRQVSLDRLCPRCRTPFVGFGSNCGCCCGPRLKLLMEPVAGGIGGDFNLCTFASSSRRPRVKAVVLRVDSPGGGVLASEQIRHEVGADPKIRPPVVASMGGMAASGGYWISMNADAIVAERPPSQDPSEFLAFFPISLAP